MTDSVFNLEGVSVDKNKAQAFSSHRIYVQNGDTVLAEVIRALSQAGHRVLRVEMTRPTLEDVFPRLTEENMQRVTP